jgi:hypothetical protein
MQGPHSYCFQGKVSSQKRTLGVFFGLLALALVGALCKGAAPLQEQ